MNKGIIFSTSNYRGPRVCGPYRIATVAREHGWDVEVVDYLSYWTLDELKQLARTRIDKNTKFIGLSYLFIDIIIPVVDEFLSWIRDTYPDVKIIAGHGTMSNNFISKHIHYHIRGFGEHAFIALLRYLFSNGPAPKFRLPYTNVIDANSFYPAFPMEELRVEYEVRDFIRPQDWLMVEFGRGCIFSCAYCSFPVIGVRGDYSRSADDLRTQLQKTYDDYGVTSYGIADETFNDRTEKVTKFANAIEQLSFKPRFSAYIRPDLLVRRPEDREELLRMNVIGHYYGVETFNTPTGKAVGKGMSGEEMKEGLLSVRKYFEQHAEYYRASLSFIYGLPYETKQTLDDAEQWYMQNWQQQRIFTYPLRIDSSEANVTSKISANLEKYGYTEVDPVLADRIIMAYARKHPEHTGVLLSETNDAARHQRGLFAEDANAILWKNPDMSLLDAVVRVEQWQQRSLRHDFRLGAFELGYVSADDMSTRLTRHADNDDEIITSHGFDIIGKYKYQKLNWK